MIRSDECYLQDTCRKFKREGSCGDNPFCMRLFKIDTLYNNALFTDSQKRRITLRLDNTEQDKYTYDTLKSIEENITDFVNSGKNLYIHSTQCGNGKTSWSIRLIQDYIQNIWIESSLTCRALFINVPRFLLTLKDSITNQSDYIDYIKANVLDADLVVWDDIATKSLTTFEAEHLLSIIDTRINNNKSNIYTSNLTPQELIETVGNRLYSRIINLSTDIEFKEGDKRTFK